MTRLAEIQGHVASMRELSDIMSAMRSLAGMRVQEAQRALPGIRSYSGSMAAAIASALMLMGPQEAAPQTKAGRRALILCMAEHGFVAGFNERLVDAAEAGLSPDDALLVLGSRGAAFALERGREAAWTRAMATRSAGALDTVNSVTKELYARIARGEIDRVEVMFSRYRQGSQQAIERRLLLPLDLAMFTVSDTRQPPLHNLKPAILFEELAAEYVFAILMEAAVESIASENAARFAAMQSACDNVSNKLEELQEQARQARQNEITTELLDLITGAEAMKTRHTTY